MYTYKKITLNEAKFQFITYTSKLRLVDTYWEDYILESDIYEVDFDDKMIGIFSIHVEENMLTSFYISDDYVHLAQPIFKKILDELTPTCAYVVTNDELMLSLCMDNHFSVELQAYFFDDSNSPVKDAEYGSETLKLCCEADIEELTKADFFKPPYVGNDENLIYVMRDKVGAFMGAGHIQRMELQREWGAIGMYVVPEFRQMGVGRSIIIHLKKITKQMGLIPIAGCWYYNHGSKKTLESCGLTSKTRLFKVYFKSDK